MNPAIESLVRESVERMQSGQVPVQATTAAPEAIPLEGIRDVIDRLIDNLQYVDAEEAAEILAKIEMAAAAFATGNWIGGMLALMAALRLYRQAIRD